MRRREFITLIGGAVAWPLAGRAQTNEPMPRIGILMPFGTEDPQYQARIADRIVDEFDRRDRVELAERLARQQDIERSLKR